MKDLKWMEITEAELFAVSAGSFLCNPLPADWDSMDMDEAGIWLANNAWQPFENCDPCWLFEVIDDHKTAIEEFLKNKGIEVKGSDDEEPAKEPSWQVLPLNVLSYDGISKELCEAIQELCKAHGCIETSDNLANCTDNLMDNYGDCITDDLKAELDSLQGGRDQEDKT